MKQLLTLLFTSVIANFVHADPGTDVIEASGVKGGVVVHVGCGEANDAVPTHQLRANNAYLVHGLARNDECIARARRDIRAVNLYGPVSVDRWDGHALPYADNSINLFVIEDGIQLAEEEIMRALAPLGVAMRSSDGQWIKTTKQWPQEIDQWTHFLHGPDNNAVAQDQVVGVPKHVQWVGDPKFARSHEHLASVSAMVSAQGRLFYIIDEGLAADIRMPPRWHLVARDAFNGMILWKRRMGKWTDHLHGFRSGPADLPFRLVAHGDRVYVTLGLDEPVTALEAATGRTVTTFTSSEYTQQIVHAGDALIMLRGSSPAANRRGAPESASARKAVMAASADTGEVLWQKDLTNDAFLPAVVAGDTLLYQTRGHLVCLKLQSGDEKWRRENPLSFGKSGTQTRLGSWVTPTLTAQNGIVYVADFQKLTAFSVDDGTALWTTSSAPGFNSPPDVFVIDDQVWRGYQRGRGTADFGEGLDAETGKIVKEIETAKAWSYPTLAHYRCYRPKATSRFILSSRSGIEFINIESGENYLNHWVRGTCQYGIMPCNGLVYAPPHSCACNIKTMVRGMCAFASSSRTSSAPRTDVRFEKGPAYTAISDKAVSDQPADERSQDDWSTFRHDEHRSGKTPTQIANRLRQAWKTKLGGRLSSPVLSQGKIFVAAVDAHTVHALDMTSGSELWSFTAGGRVDSPPTIHGKMVLFGSADGWVYCLRADDGALAWRFRGAPHDRRITVRGQLESRWPVHGSVLVTNGTLVVAAGRSSYLDGGIFVYRMEPKTGKVLSETVIDSLVPENAEQPEGGVDLRGVLNDVLATAGEAVYMRHLKIDFQTGDDLQIGPPHLFAPMGFLDDAWWHRSYWLFGADPVCMPPTNESGWNIWPRVGNMVPSGRILSLGDDVVYGFGRNRYPGGGAGQIRGGENYHLFAMQKDATEPLPSYKDKQHLRHFRSGQKLGLPVTERDKRYGEPKLHQAVWSRQVPILVRAMVLTDKTLVLAGPPEVTLARSQSLVLEDPDELESAFLGKRGAKLLLNAAADGHPLAEYDLASSPVFDGLIVAQGRVLVALENGSIVCFAQ